MIQDNEILGLFRPVEGFCAVCDVRGQHIHFDRALHDIVCVGCWSPLLVAQIEFSAALQRGCLTSDQLRIAIANFERPLRRVIRPFGAL